jgi:L-threonylcarbamoyladenylate synthase
VSNFFSTCDTDAIANAAAQLLAGNLVAFPTETVYGLGADASNKSAVAKIYAAKGRPADHPLIVHIASMAGLEDWAQDVPQYAIALARDFWPGPMTLVLKRSALAGDYLTGGQDTIGVRVPNNKVALGLLETFEQLGGKGVAAPSANRFGNVSPTTAQAVAAELTDYLTEGDLILDGGASAVGVESTIIDCTATLPTILRPGAITLEMITASTQLAAVGQVASTQIRVSGSLASHYAPAATVVLDQTPLPGQGFIATADIPTPEGVIRLAAPQTNDEFARILYSSLRAADEQGIETVVVINPVGEGIAIAIRDRLKRAAH